MEIEFWRIYMEENLKQLLLKDLCARLPYHTIVKYRNADVDLTQYIRSVKLTECKPYLRPISSITEEEERELNRLLPEVYDFTFRMEELLELIQMQKEIPFHYLDWLNAHHFDYRGLIEKGLALEAKKGMYN